MLNMEKNQVVLMRKSLQRSVATAAISLLLLLLAACSNDKHAGGTSEETQIIAIEDRTVAGVSQKGPFLQGSSITVQELDGEALIESGKLRQTGKSFKGKIASDTGTFLIKDISLKSQFALLETEGFYRNEVTGEVSKSQITLNALVDLSERETANINLLTHLEYERVVELVGSGETISSAKKKAESDVFKAFGIEVDNASAEDLDIFAKGDDNAALLAISILMQGNLSEGNLSNRLAGFASDIEKDGSWDDENEKTDIADWASTADLAKIRANIRSWELGEDVPAFEKFFKRFWWNNFKLGECDAETAGMTKKNKNELSATYGEDYRCAANEWKLASKTDDGSSDDFSYGSLTDKRDNKTYKTIVIGNQEWMAENLNYAYKAGGSIYGNTCYGGDSDNCIKYGRLYTWGAVMDTVKTGCGIDMGTGQEPTEDCGALEKKVKAGEHVQGICPDGWHLPSHTEILTLFNYVNSITGYDPMAHQTAAALKELINSGKIDSLKKIQIASLLDSVNVKGDSPFNALRAKNDWAKKGTDIVGFSALPAGKCDARTSACDGKGAATGFWMAGWDEAPTDLYPSDYAAWMNAAGLKVLTFTDGVQWAWTREPPEGLEFSVRCVNNTAKESKIIYGSLKDSRDTKVYKTVKIGDQVWMAENLNYKAYGSVCYGEDDANCSKYGRLYTWGGAMDSSKTNCGYGEGDGCSDLVALVKAKKNVQGICPAGSHLPSYDEMQTMLALVGGGNATAEGSATAGTALKAKSGWNSGNGTDTYGFSALPAGRWEEGYGGSFENAGKMTGFWSTNFDNYYGHVLHVTSGAETEYWQAPKQLGYSVRCIVD